MLTTYALTVLALAIALAIALTRPPRRRRPIDHAAILATRDRIVASARERFGHGAFAMAVKYNGKDLSLTFDAIEFKADGTAVTLDNEEGDQGTVTFADVGTGDTRQWFFQITALGDYAAGTIWDKLWTKSGQDVPFVFKPYGNAVATAAKPHFTGTARILAKPPIGGQAGEDWTYEARLNVNGVPTRVVA